jgi:hypothetical protein
MLQKQMEWVRRVDDVPQSFDEKSGQSRLHCLYDGSGHLGPHVCSAYCRRYEQEKKKKKHFIIICFLLGWKQEWQIELLPLDKYFIGSVAKHYQLSTWVSILWAIREIFALVILGVIGVFILGGLSMKYYLRHQRSIADYRSK